MKKLLARSALLALILTCLAGTAWAQGVDLISRQKVATALEEQWRIDVYRFQAVEGDLATILITASKKTGLVPEVTLIGPDGEVVLPDVVKGKLKAKKLAMAATGLYYLSITGGRTTGDYKLALKLKGAKIAPMTVAVPGVVAFESPRGALLTVTIKAEKGSDVEPGVDSITDSTGADVLDGEALTEKGGLARVKKNECPVFGEHTIALADDGAQILTL